MSCASKALVAAVVLAVFVLRPVVAGDVQIDGSFVSTAPPGTPPLVVDSTTRVDGLNADLLDGLDASAFAPAPERVLWVSPSGGDFTSVQAALAAITDAGPSNRYLIRVGPGFYEGLVVMKPHVDIEGSGEGLTILRRDVSGTVWGASNAELRDLTVENLSDEGVGILINSEAPRIVRVTVRADVSSGASKGILNVGTPPAPPLLRQVTVSVTGSLSRGISNEGAPARMVDVTVKARGPGARGIVNQDGAHSSMVRVQATATAEVIGETTVTAISNVASEVTMVDVEAIARNGQFNYAVANDSGTARIPMFRVRAFAFGGQNAYAVRTWEGDTDLVECDLRASGASSANYALWNNRSSTRIYRSRLVASGNASDIALKNHNSPAGGGPWSVEVHASQLWGPTRTVSNLENFTTRIGASSLAGGPPFNTGTLLCAGVYDEDFTFYFDSCP